MIEQEPHLPDNRQGHEKALEAEWDKRYRGGYYEGRYNVTPEVIDFLRKYGENLKQGTILDEGCGNGKNLLHMLQEGFQVTGFDISKEGLTQLKQILDKEGLSADLVQGSIYHLPYEDESFSGLVTTNVFQHNDWQGAEQSFAEATRVLKPGGLMLFTARSVKRDVPQKLLLEDRGITFKVGIGLMFHHFSREEIEELAEKNSLDILKMEEKIQEDRKGTEVKTEHWIWEVVLRKMEK